MVCLTALLGLLLRSFLIIRFLVVIDEAYPLADYFSLLFTVLLEGEYVDFH